MPAAAAPVPGGSLADDQPADRVPPGPATPLEFVAGCLVAGDDAGWTPAGDLVRGELDALFGMPRRLWQAPGHAAAVLAWKIYAYRLAQPLAMAWTLAREVPLLSADNVLVKFHPGAPYLTAGLRRPTSAVLPTSRAARSHDAIIVPDEPGLLAFARQGLLCGHLEPLIERTRRAARIGAPILRGQVAAGIAYAFRDVCAAAGREVALVTAALGLGGLAGVTADGTWRTTCCRALSAPGLSACADCPARTREGWRPRR